MYLSYYSSHGIIMLVPLFMFYNLDYKLSKYSWLRTFGILNVLMIFILPLNFLIGNGANYMYLYEAPNIKNPLVFGDWPYYISKLGNNNYSSILLDLFNIYKKKNMIRKSPIEIFSDWVDLGKDDGMEKNHSESVNAMLNKILKNLDDFTFIDAGCGNGWVVRMVSQMDSCFSAVGVDGSSKDD